MKRSEMLEDCPEDFENRLVEIIDYIESQVNDINSNLDIKYIEDLDKLDEAKSLAEKLLKDLY